MEIDIKEKEKTTNQKDNSKKDKKYNNKMDKKSKNKNYRRNYKYKKNNNNNNISNNNHRQNNNQIQWNPLQIPQSQSLQLPNLIQYPQLSTLYPQQPQFYPVPVHVPVPYFPPVNMSFYLPNGF